MTSLNYLAQSTRFGLFAASLFACTQAEPRPFASHDRHKQLLSFSCYAAQHLLQVSLQQQDPGP